MATKAKAGDLTGRQREEMVKSLAEEKAKADQEKVLAAEAEAKRIATEVTDLTQSLPTTIIDEVESVGVDLADDTEVVRVAEDIDNMTFVAGNYYTFKAGQKYKVPRDLANHLRSLRLLYDRA